MSARQEAIRELLKIAKDENVDTPTRVQAALYVAQYGRDED